MRPLRQKSSRIRGCSAFQVSRRRRIKYAIRLPANCVLQESIGYLPTRPIGRENVVAFYNKRGTCEQWLKEGKGAIKWTRLSCRSFAANAVRLQLPALAYNLGNFLRTLATPDPIKIPWGRG